MAVSPSTNNAFSSFVNKQISVQSAKKTESTVKSAELSSGAKEYLKKLKEKFGNVDFIISDYASEDDASQKLKSGKGEYNCIITPDLLEKMAADESVAAKYEGIITEATGELDGLKESVEEKGLEEDVKNYGISVDGDGKVNYYVLLKDGLSKLNSHSETNGKKNEKTTAISANSIDELLKKLEEHKSEKSGLFVNKHGDGFEKKDKDETSGVYKNIKKHTFDKSGKKGMMEKLFEEMQEQGGNHRVHSEKAYEKYDKHAARTHSHSDGRKDFFGKA